MVSKNNSIYLAYSQDAVKRLPVAIASFLNTIGFDIYINTSQFLRLDFPPENVLTEIENRDCFLLVLTPASIRWGFNFGDVRLKNEIKMAKQHDLRFVIVCAYGLVPEETNWWFHFGFPDDAEIVRLTELNFVQNLRQLLSVLDVQHCVERSIPSLLELTIKQLRAEQVLDLGLTEDYDSMNDNRKSNAIISYDTAINIDPDYATAYSLRADIYYRFSKRSDVDGQPLIESAINDYTHAIKLDPEEARFYAGRARIYRDQHAYDNALADYTSALQLSSSTSSYFSARASIHRQLGNIDEAIVDYTSAIELQPDNAGYYYARSGLHAGCKAFERAIGDLSRAIDLNPRANWYVLRGFLYMDLEMPEKAEADWNQALEVAYQKDEVYLFRARIHQSRGEAQEAWLFAQEAVAINPNNKWAQGIIKRLKNRRNSL